ncbi:MAG: protein kinase [Chloroflexi bacterium]|nr:protein kinase [Chloroflexota bacterium]MBU1748549.1 protein kinase [Chloroflexota bacterium]
MTEVLTLADLMETRPLEPIQVTYVALGLIQALERAHAQKPAGMQGRVRGRLAPQDVLLTDHISLAERPVPADPQYETPDHLRGAPITPQTDLYAYGLLLYELLTRRPPFVAPDPAALRERQLDAPVPDPRLHAPDLDLDLLILLLSLLDKDPAFRPASSAGVRQRLTAIWKMDRVADLPDGLVGKLLGRCQVAPPIGDGPLAWVFMARDIFNEQPVAVKVFKPGVKQDPTPLIRFRENAPKLFELNSPVIATPLAAGEFAGWWYLFVRHVRGRTLRDLIDAAVQDEAPFSRREVLRLLDQIARALMVLHEHGLAHGNLTPNNVILSAEGLAVLTDVSLAAMTPVASERPALAGIQQVQGTPAYLAPEQIRGGPATPAADVYALGIIAYELITGRPPFMGETPADVLVQQLEDTPPSVRSRAPDLPVEIDIALRRALAKDPAERLESVAIVPRALDNAWYVPPPPPPPKPPRPSPVERLRQDPAARRRLGVGAAVVGAILLAVCLVAGIGSVLLNAGPLLMPASNGTATPLFVTATPGAVVSPTVSSTATPAPTNTSAPVARTYRATYGGPQAFPGCAIRGRIFNAAGQGEAGVWVELYNSNKQWLLTTATGPGGWYDFTTSPGGYYLKLKNRTSAWSPLVELKFEQMAVVDWRAR